MLNILNVNMSCQRKINQAEATLTLFLMEKIINLLIHFVFHCSLQAMSGFLMMLTQNGKLLYISDNAAEYLGHSMVSGIFFLTIFSSFTSLVSESRYKTAQ